MEILGKGLNVLRATLHDPADTNVHEAFINTPCDVSTLLGMAIYKIIIDPQGFTFAAAVSTPKQECAISTRQGVATIPKMDMSGTIMYLFYEMYMTAQAAGQGGTAIEIRPPGGIEFYNPPLIVCDKQLSLYSMCNADMNAVGRWVRCAIFYQLIKLSQQEFIAALSVMETL